MENSPFSSSFSNQKRSIVLAVLFILFVAFLLGTIQMRNSKSSNWPEENAYDLPEENRVIILTPEQAQSQEKLLSDSWLTRELVLTPEQIEKQKLMDEDLRKAMQSTTTSRR